LTIFVFSADDSVGHRTKRHRFAASSDGTIDEQQQSPNDDTSGQTYVNQSPLDASLAKEINRYSGVDNEFRTRYRPGPLSKSQLRKAAEEFVRRCQENLDEQSESAVPYVLVSQNCTDHPRRDYELKALKSTDIAKLWYALTKTGDLFIIKYSSSDAYADGATELGRVIGNFAIQFEILEHPVFFYGGDGKKKLLSHTIIAPDALLNRIYPKQQPPVDVRAPFIVELEHESRGPKEFMELLSTYLLQPVADYVLGIKVYNRSGPPALGAEERSFAAVALLWRRSTEEPLLPGRQATLVLARSFGTCPLSSQSILAFCTQGGLLEQVKPEQLNHPENHTATTDTVTIPKAHLVHGAVDISGNPVYVRSTDEDLTISLARLRGIFDATLPS
jgi:hypothetical protein